MLAKYGPTEETTPIFIDQKKCLVWDDALQTSLVDSEAVDTMDAG